MGREKAAKIERTGRGAVKKGGQREEIEGEVSREREGKGCGQEKGRL